jgi:hypothetical protein
MGNLSKTVQILTIGISVLIAARRRHANIGETAQGHATPSMRQVSLARWLREMKVDTLTEGHAQDAWYVCNFFCCPDTLACVSGQILRERFGLGPWTPGLDAGPRVLGNRKSHLSRHLPCIIYAD